eukprot:c18929_g1_i1.p1 GENE.c18929_g1_i1~~c18929_g1_i1.p1  ORF type:complete len:418 (+),score=59.82 c18929_g1_i1:464-1717(+)
MKRRCLEGKNGNQASQLTDSDVTPRNHPQGQHSEVVTKAKKAFRIVSRHPPSTPAFYDSCRRLMKLLWQREEAASFDCVVNLNAPDYKDLIDDPIDLSSIHHKLHTVQYTSYEQFAEDMRKMFQNCETYAQLGKYCKSEYTELVKHAKTLRQIFDEKEMSLVQSGLLELDTTNRPSPSHRPNVQKLRRRIARLETHVQTLLQEKQKMMARREACKGKGEGSTEPQGNNNTTQGRFSDRLREIFGLEDAGEDPVTFADRMELTEMLTNVQERHVPLIIKLLHKYQPALLSENTNEHDLDLELLTPLAFRQLFSLVKSFKADKQGPQTPKQPPLETQHACEAAWSDVDPNTPMTKTCANELAINPQQPTSLAFHPGDAEETEDIYNEHHPTNERVLSAVDRDDWANWLIDGSEFTNQAS